MSNDELETLAMGKLYDWIERIQLKNLNLPTIASGERGYAAVPMSKMLQLAWIVSRPVPPLIRSSVQAATAMGGSTGLKVTVPAGRQYSILSVYLTFVATATSGNRDFYVQVKDQSGQAYDTLVHDSPIAAGVTRLTNIGPASSGLNNVVLLQFPLFLPEGWYLHIFDNSNIDVNDTLAYAIKYQDDEKPPSQVIIK